MMIMEKVTPQNAFERIKAENMPVIIFGAGVVGEILYHTCTAAGLKVEAFCDNNINKAGTTRCDTEIIHTSTLKSTYDDAIFLISAADIQDVVAQLHRMGYSRWHPATLLLRGVDLAHYPMTAPLDFAEFAMGACFLSHDSYLTPNKIYLRSVDIIITERCSLRCRDCANLMQYYQAPVNCDTEEVIQHIDNFCAIVDEIHEFRVIGGEPFMNKDFHLVVKHLIDEPKVKRVVIYTNGTIAPKADKIKYLSSDKVLVFITDYGQLSKGLDKLTQSLQKNGVPFYAHKAQLWTACSKIAEHNRNIEQRKAVFQSCCAKNLVTLSDGKVHRCPFSANASRLQAAPDYPNDYVDISRMPQNAADIDVLKKKIRAFLLDKDYLETCDYCDGRPFEAPEIPAAIQTKKPLDYQRY